MIVWLFSTKQIISTVDSLCVLRFYTKENFAQFFHEKAELIKMVDMRRLALRHNYS